MNPTTDTDVECITECPVCPEVDFDTEVPGWGSVGALMMIAFMMGLVLG